MGPRTAGTVREALEASTAAIAAAGAGQPRLDAELLLADALDLDRAALVADPDRGVDPTQGRRFGEMVRRRVAREPVAYILGRKGFRHLELRVDGRALIPRPETELLVELALELRPKVVIDVGTGSGAVALAIADEVEGTSVVGTDISQLPLELARENARALELDTRARFLEASLPNGAAADLLVANLPYVAEAEWEGLEPEITQWEPRPALVSGPTGLESIERLLGEVATGDGWVEAIGLEVGAGQAAPVAELVRRAGFERVEARRDLAGIERVVVGRR
ncbi:MAG: peptide chain release factor N(5)-glutamine methyltransferase [Solirubrobacterales bacterium]